MQWTHGKIGIAGVGRVNRSGLSAERSLNAIVDLTERAKCGEWVRHLERILGTDSLATLTGMGVGFGYEVC